MVRNGIGKLIRKNMPMTISEIDDLLNQIKGSRQMDNFMMDTTYPYTRLTIKEISNNVEDASKQMGDVFKYVREGGGIPLKKIQETILPTIKQAAEIPHLYHLFYELNAKDEYTYRHTICVGIIANLIGTWLHLPKKDLEILTLGATLHDIGKTKISDEILNKPGKLSKEEYEEMRLHTVYGYELLKQIDSIDEKIALIALQHHEREDGKGYPLGLDGQEISYFSKIVAVADIFHAMSSSRVYHHASPFYTVMKQMNKDAYGKLDPTIVLTFLNKMMNSLVGKRVKLTDNSEGTIIMIDPYDPIRCLIQVEDHHIDLRYNTRLQIERIIDDPS